VHENVVFLLFEKLVIDEYKNTFPMNKMTLVAYGSLCLTL